MSFLGTIIGGLLSGGASLLSGMGRKASASEQRALELKGLREYNVRSTVHAQRATAAIKQQNVSTRQINKTMRTRADRAAKVPLVELGTQWNRVDVGRMVKDAEANGFNPLTFLRSGALPLYAQGFSRQRTTGHNAMAAALAPQMGLQAEYVMPNLVPEVPSTQVPSNMEVFGGAAQAAVSTGLQMYDAQANRDFQQGIVNAQLQAYNQRGSYRGGSFNTPSSSSSGGSMTMASGGGGAAGGPGTLPSPFMTPEQLGVVSSQPGKTGGEICWMGWCVQLDRGTSTGQTVEDFLGEIGGAVWGGAVLAAAGFKELNKVQHPLQGEMDQFAKAGADVRDFAKRAWDAYNTGWERLKNYDPAWAEGVDPFLNTPSH